MHLREVLSSPSPWQDLIEVVAVPSAPDLSGCEGPLPVRQPRSNRKLQPAEIAEVVASYEEGATIRSLARQYGMHEQTVRAHLRRQAVTLRPTRGVKDEDLGLVVALDQTGLGEIEIAKRLGIGQTAVRTALRRASLGI